MFAGTLSSSALIEGVGWPVGWLLMALGVCFLLPMAIALGHGEPLLPFFLGLGGCLLLGLFLIRFCSKTSSNTVHVVRGRMGEGFLLTVVSWIAVSFFAALPFYGAGVAPSFTDAFFESVSCLTTTGSSFLGPDRALSHSLRFWTLFLQWVGGFGIILMAVTLLPALKVRGTRLITSEFSDRSEKTMPRAYQIAKSLTALYGGLTLLSAFLLMAGGLSKVEALYYSMASISTGGVPLSPYPLALLSPYCKSVLVGIMILGGSTLLLLVQCIHREVSYCQDDEVRGYGKLLGVTFLATMLWNQKVSILDNLLLATSAVTTTGVTLEGKASDHFLRLLFLLVGTIGGCSGSTAGGIKVFRLQILYRMAKSQIFRMLNPYRFFVTLYKGMPVEEKTLIALITVSFLYVMGWFLFALSFSSLGHSLEESFFFAMSFLSNSGPSSGLQTLSFFGKWLAILGMLCGRFEFVTLLAALCIPLEKKHY